MLRRAILAVAVGLTVVATAATAPAVPTEPTEKCDDLQNRCLHRENGICVIWHDECLARRPPTHGEKRPKKGFGRHKPRV